MPFKTTKYLVPKSLAPFKTSVCINSSVSATVSDGADFDSTNTAQSCVALVQYSISNSTQVADLDYFNSGDIYLYNLVKFSLFVTTKFFLTFLCLLVSFLTLCYSSKLLLIFYLVFNIFNQVFFNNSVKLCGFKFQRFTIHFSSDFIFMRRYTNF